MAFFGGAVAAAVGWLVACSDTVDHVTPPAKDGGAGADTGPPVTDASQGTLVTQKGTIIELGTTSTGVEGATVDFGGGHSGTSAAKGAYSVQVPAKEPFSMLISAPDHTTIGEQEWFITGDFDRKTTSLPDKSTTQQLLQALNGIDPDKGVLSVGLFRTGACTDIGGATIALDPPGASKITYFKNQFPVSQLTTTQTGENTPSAVIYNLEPGDTFNVKVTHPTCTQAPFPFTPTGDVDDIGDNSTITYTGKVKVAPANPAGAPAPRTSFMRIYMTQ